MLRQEESESLVIFSGIEPDTPTLISPARFERFASVLAKRLRSAGVRITAEIREDGRVALIMPLEWGQVFLHRLAVDVDHLKEELRKAALEVRRRGAELQATSEKARQQWDLEGKAIHREYKKLVAGGLSHREALHRIKAKCGEMWTITMLETTISCQRGKERRERRKELEARIQRKAQNLTRKEIAQQEGLSVSQVKWALQKDQPRTRPYVSRTALKEQRELILALYQKGQKPKQIAEALDVRVQRVHNTLHYARMKATGGRRKEEHYEQTAH